MVFNQHFCVVPEHFYHLRAATKQPSTPLHRLMVATVVHLWRHLLWDSCDWCLCWPFPTQHPVTATLDLEMCSWGPCLVKCSAQNGAINFKSLGLGVCLLVMGHALEGDHGASLFLSFCILAIGEQPLHHVPLLWFCLSSGQSTTANQTVVWSLHKPFDKLSISFLQS